MGLGTGMVRETSSLMLGNYFKRRREFVEMVVQAGAGVGIALFSVFYKEAVVLIISTKGESCRSHDLTYEYVKVSLVTFL
ncbi:unnamed protein product [Timema podura]|uniref:Uncharacterized protein n=1 Tax=Timema podura TaxID=61482 RepID=A0ABN7PTJ4_TIMPD|nr:unnamed protein product [Timema podura]